jgi:hypothetical protein
MFSIVTLRGADVDLGEAVDRASLPACQRQEELPPPFVSLPIPGAKSATQWSSQTGAVADRICWA